MSKENMESFPNCLIKGADYAQDNKTWISKDGTKCKERKRIHFDIEYGFTLDDLLKDVNMLIDEYGYSATISQEKVPGYYDGVNTETYVEYTREATDDDRKLLEEFMVRQKAAEKAQEERDKQTYEKLKKKFKDK